MKYDLEERTARFGEKIIDWLRILAKAYGELAEECRKLWQEAQEYTLIFSKIAKSTK